MIDAASLTQTLGGKWRGNRGNAPCPICQPERRRDQNGLSLRLDGGLLLAFCHKQGCAFGEIVMAAGLPPGAVRLDPHAKRAAQVQEAKDAAQRERQARAVWSDPDCLPIQGSLAETYLRGRGITCALPDCLRFHPSGWHPTAQRLPMMVARVEGGAGFAVHRTYLSPGGGRAPVDPNKAMLGACAGGAVQVARAKGPLVVAEGIETALSLASGLLNKPATIWAALSTSGMRGLILPPLPGRLTVAADGDKPGREAAMALASRAEALGWHVSLLPAPDGKDWNDVLARKGGAA
jgi:hypothetical protein